MYLNSPFYSPDYSYKMVRLPQSYKPLDRALELVKAAVQGEREDELFYDYLISMASTAEEKNIITTIRDDERKHNKLFREIYRFYTGKTIPAPTNIEFQKPSSYIEGIKKAKFGELGAVERYRDIRAGLPDRYYRDMVFEILTDELKHADKYDYILYLSLANKIQNGISGSESSIPMAKTSYTPEEALQIAQILGIDFSREKFNLEQFRVGLNTELEHGRRYYPTNVTEDNPIITGKIALAHLKEFPDYYTRLSKLEEEAKLYWSTHRDFYRQVREFTLSELAQFDGSMGRPAYVAVNGIVYDVSNNATWGGGTHFGLDAGKDLTPEFQSCHGIESILAKLPKVGILKAWQ
jgi:predicted heme/steroid binding protein/rubrerythrin